jgi:hypothetical protein
MCLNRKTGDAPRTEMECVRLLKGLGDGIGNTLFRVIFYGEGRLEVEFQARNPWECLVFKLESWEELLDFLNKRPQDIKAFENSVIRKKCAKCFLHERVATSSDI